MELIVITSNFVKMFTISILTYFLYNKIINYTNNNILKNLFVLFCSISLATIYVILSYYFHPLSIIILLYTVYGIILNVLIKEKCFNYMAYIFSCILSYVIYLISIVLTGGVLIFTGYIGDNFKDPISLILIPIVAILIGKRICKIRRFKNGLNFLKDTSENRKIMIFIIFFTGIFLLLFGIYQKNNNNMLIQYLFLGTVLTAIGLIFWIKSQITKTYKNKMRDRTIEIQKTEIDEKDRIIENIKAENLKLATAVHKYNKKFSSLEFAMKNAIELDSKTEFANEISVILEEYQEASKNFAKEVQVNKNKLPLTNILGIDNMFKYMQEEAINKNINFDLKINENINSLIGSIISKDKFETLIGDHLKDAIIAVDLSDASYRSILVTLGVVQGIYELSICDTGIEFEIDTLLKLGKEQVTTHKDDGGSGIGFMTTFETLKECKASLIIEEYNPETTNYTKCVTIKFDGKNEYKIISYRAEEIKEQNNGRKILIEELK